GVRSGHGIGVVDGPVLAREGDEPRGLAKPVLELRTDLVRPVLEPGGRVIDDLPDLRDLPSLLGTQGEPKVEGKVGSVGGYVRKPPAHALLVCAQPVDRRAREADQCHVPMAEVKTRGVEFVTEIRAAGARAAGVV